MKRTTKMFKGLLGGGLLTLLLVFALAGHAAAQSVTLISDDPVHTFPIFIATDGVDLFVTSPNSGGGQSIFKIPIGGGTVTTLYSAFNPRGITVLSSDVFWIDPNSGPFTATQILRAPKDGSGPVTVIYNGAFVGQPIVDGSDITTDGAKLYTADFVQGRVHSLDPTFFPPSLSLANGMTFLGSRYGGFFDKEHVNTITESGGTLFIADDGSKPAVSPAGVFSIPALGGPFTPLHVGAPFVSPVGIAVGNGTIFIADPGANTIWFMPISGGTPAALVSGAPFQQPHGLTFFNNALYVTDVGNAKIWKVDFAKDPLTLIENLLVDVVVLNLNTGIENSLDAKLDAVFLALNDLNDNNDQAAINMLEAFINAVAAQSGKKIDAEDAAALIASAQAIIDLLTAP